MTHDQDAKEPAKLPETSVVNRMRQGQIHRLPGQKRFVGANITKFQVGEFHAAFDHPIRVIPTLGTPEQRLLRARLIMEEAFEFCEAAGVQVWFDDADPVAWEFINLEIDDDAEPNIVEMADALGDLDYVVQGANLVFGFPAEGVLEEIHASNMSKLGGNGRPIKREDGKTLKGPNYFRPNIASVLRAADPNVVIPPPANTDI